MRKPKRALKKAREAHKAVDAAWALVRGSVSALEAVLTAHARRRVRWQEEQVVWHDAHVLLLVARERADEAVEASRKMRAIVAKRVLRAMRARSKR